MKPKAYNPKNSITESLVILFSIFLFIITLMGFSGKAHWTFELVSHFRVQVFQLCLFPCAIFLWRRRYRLMTACLLLCILNYSTVIPLYWGKPSRNHKENQPIRVMQANLYANNTNTTLLIDAIQIYEPDLMIFQEATPHWAAALKAIEEDYPYSHTEPQTGCFGMLLLSKYPLENKQTAYLAQTNHPTLIADLYFNRTTITIIGTHPVPPINKTYSNVRNQHLCELVPLILNQQHPVILAGDLNCTPWSPYFADLLDSSGLYNSMKGFGFQPSWPSQALIGKIPIDHILHNPQIKTINRMIGPYFGSDHRPVICDLMLP